MMFSKEMYQTLHDFDNGIHVRSVKDEEISIEVNFSRTVCIQTYLPRVEPLLRPDGFKIRVAKLITPRQKKGIIFTLLLVWDKE